MMIWFKHKIFEFIILTVCAIPLALADPSLENKKIIEWGWDEPDPKFMRENIKQMEKMPFDGLVFHVISAQGIKLAWEVWGHQRFEIEDFQQAITDLQSTKFHRFTDLFLRVNVEPGDVDWFDDAAWAVVLNNFGVAAQIAKVGGIKGLMFDTEQYKSSLFSYSQISNRNGKSFGEYQSKVRQRGREWIQEINYWFPNITILLTYGYKIAQPRTLQFSREKVRYGLLADFLNGVFDACSDQTKIVDVWEPAYSYKQLEQFKKAYDTIKIKSVEWTDSPEKYRQHIRAGFGIMMDYNWRKIPWDVNDVLRNYFSPTEFEDSVRAALSTSDQYIWIYTEQPRWWTNQRLPKDYIEALVKARTEK